MSSKDKNPKYVLDKLNVDEVEKKTIKTDPQTYTQAGIEVDDAGTYNIVLGLIISVNYD